MKEPSLNSYAVHFLSAAKLFFKLAGQVLPRSRRELEARYHLCKCLFKLHDNLGHFHLLRSSAVPTVLTSSLCLLEQELACPTPEEHLLRTIKVDGMLRSSVI